MEDITIEELKQKIDNQDDFLLIDVREDWEYNEFNINAKLIPLGTLQGAIDDLDDWMEKEVVVHCKSGGRSAAALVARCALRAPLARASASHSRYAW